MAALRSDTAAPARPDPSADGSGAVRLRVLRWRDARSRQVDDWLAEEVPVALQYNGVSHAVMLATPLDLEDFALGFSLSEGIIAEPGDLYDCEVLREARGITLQLEVATRCFEGLRERRRSLAGRTGCGLCGTDSLDQALRPVPPLPREAGARPVAARAIARALRALRARQPLNELTGSVHAAAWCDAEGGLLLLREDVGRHNALDKLVGALARAGADAGSGFVVVTSRASVEMVQKAAQARVALFVAVSAPTGLAVRTARDAGMSLVGLARGDDLVIYSGAQRVALEASPSPSRSLIPT